MKYMRDFIIQFRLIYANQKEKKKVKNIQPNVNLCTWECT